ncbi:hypothetical protein BH24ACT16_BH24ACT16_10740 [soil metagenome]
MAFVLIAFVALFFILFLLLVPVLYSIQAVGSLFVYPRQLKTMFGNKILRRNHALEHATIAVMMEREPGRKLNGFSNDDGFYVQGVRSLEEVDSAARAALDRLHGGEKSLAIHRNCGTTIVAANLLAAVTFIGVIAAGLFMGMGLGVEFYLLLVAGMLVSLMLRVPLSLFLQRFVTTQHDLSNAEVGWVEPANPNDLRAGIVGMLLASSTVQVRIFHTDPDAVEIIRDDGVVVR